MLHVTLENRYNFSPKFSPQNDSEEWLEMDAMKLDERCWVWPPMERSILVSGLTSKSLCILNRQHHLNNGKVYSEVE